MQHIPDQVASHKVKGIAKVIHNVSSPAQAIPPVGRSNASEGNNINRRLMLKGFREWKQSSEPSQTKTSASHPTLALSSRKRYTTKVDPVLVRPGAGKGADTIKYGLMVLNFYGTDMKKKTFAVDMAMTLRWNDTRAIDLVPEGLDKVSMAWSQALELVWMPGIVVTNRDIEKYEIVSASVTIFRSGEVLRVERANARIMKKFELSEYPFDTQNLQIKIASSKYMLNEVVLEPDTNASRVDENVWGLYKMQSFDSRAYSTSDGFLEKSRGMLEVTVRRSLEKYREDHLMPTFIVQIISWAVFFFPFANPFITARLALSILTLLTFTNLMVKSDSVLPGSAPWNWNDLFNQQIQTFMFLTILLNISSEIAMHQFQNEQLARYINNEAKVVLPFIGISNIVVILTAGQYKWMDLWTATILTKASVVVMMTCYGGYVVHGVYTEHFKAKGDGAIEATTAAEGEDDGDADADCDM